MSPAYFALIRSAPCCAQVTPTVTPGWRSALHALRDLRERLGAARAATARRVRSLGPTPEMDAATLRDLGLSHRAALPSARERVADVWR